jgi:mannose-6-phosphate isomerase-like protein (cupin superfamily)
LAKSSPIQLVEVSFPAGQRVAYETTTRDVDVHQQVWIIEGAMEVTVGESQWTLDAGDCLAMRLDQPISYHNPTAKPTRYLVSLVTQAHKPPRREG